MSAARIAHAVLWPIVVTAILGLSALAGSRDTITVGPPPPPVFTQSPADALLAQHRLDCWTGEAPADMTGKLPGHVIMTLPTGRTVYSANVGRALQSVFETPERGLTVLAFCR